MLTVDSCQGSEFDYVVLSTVRANKKRKLGFVSNEQRINVAISRSRFGLIVVGKISILLRSARRIRFILHVFCILQTHGG